MYVKKPPFHFLALIQDQGRLIFYVHAMSEAPFPSAQEKEGSCLLLLFLPLFLDLDCPRYHLRRRFLLFGQPQITTLPRPVIPNPFFNVTETPDGTYLDDHGNGSEESQREDNVLLRRYGGRHQRRGGEDETELGTAKVPKFTSKKQNTTSLKVETKASNKQVDNTVANKLLSGYKSKSLAVNWRPGRKLEWEWRGWRPACWGYR